jgi:predicted aspartyl protease
VSIEFPLRSKLTAFGRVSDPTIPIAIQTLVGERTYMFLLDTGADFSVAPRRLAQQVGLEWTTLPEAQVVGVEQGGVRARVGPLPIHIGSLTCTVG